MGNSGVLTPRDAAAVGPRPFMTQLPLGQRNSTYLGSVTPEGRRFVTPGELEGLFARAGLEPEETVGIVYRPFADEFELSRNDSVNYAAPARKP